MNERIVFSKASGEGSRGGHVIGHTSGGFPIYDAHHAHYAHLSVGTGRKSRVNAERLVEHHGDYTARDHIEAAAAHAAAHRNAGGKAYDVHDTARRAHETAAKESLSGGAHGNRDRAFRTLADAKAYYHSPEFKAWVGGGYHGPAPMRPKLTKPDAESESEKPKLRAKKKLPQRIKGPAPTVLDLNDGNGAAQVAGSTASGKPVHSATDPIYAGLKGGKDHNDHDANAAATAANTRLVRKKYPTFTAREHDEASDLHSLGSRMSGGKPERVAHIQAAAAHEQAARLIKKQELAAEAKTYNSKSLSAVADLRKTQKPLGAAFSHARKVAKKNGGGRKKEREVANRYLKTQGHETMGKAMAAPTFASYAATLAAQATASSSDDHYDWGQYEKLFALNRYNIDQLRQQAAMRQIMNVQRQGFDR